MNYQHLKHPALWVCLTLFSLASCKKDAVRNNNTQTTGSTDTLASCPLSLTQQSPVGNTLHGVNWACPGDNFSSTTLVLSGLSSTDNYTTVVAESNAILSGIITNTGANTIRIPINYVTASSAWWNSYTGVIDAALGKGLNVIIGFWEASSSGDGMIDNDAQFWAMWKIVLAKYGCNANVYFEIYNEPHGYSLADWSTVCAKWLNTYPTIPHAHVLIDGTGYADDITGVGADSRFSGCLLSVHDYTFFNSGSLTTAAAWETNLATAVGAYGSRAVLTEFGDTMNSGINYTGAITGSEDIAYMQGMTNEVRNLHMGSVYWPGVRTGDGYAMEALSGSGANQILTNTNPSGLSRLQYGWGAGTGGTDQFYPGAYYRLINMNSGDLLDVNSASTSAGANLIQWYPNGGNNQQWIINSSSGNTFTLSNRNSGLFLDVSGASTADGAGIIQAASTNTGDEQWQLTAVSPGIYEIINKNSGMALTVSGASTTAGAGIIQSAYTGSTGQQWAVVQQ